MKGGGKFNACTAERVPMVAPFPSTPRKGAHVCVPFDDGNDGLRGAPCVHLSTMATMGSGVPAGSVGRFPWRIFVTIWPVFKPAHGSAPDSISAATMLSP